MKLHASGEDYLEPFWYSKSRRHGALCRCGPASGGHKANGLQCGGDPGRTSFLTMDEGYFLHLTDVGREVAEQAMKSTSVLYRPAVAAGVDPATAERDACRIEHVISDESFERLKAAAKPES